LPPFQKSNPPLSAITVPELCQNPRLRADFGTVLPPFRWLGDSVLPTLLFSSATSFASISLTLEHHLA